MIESVAHEILNHLIKYTIIFGSILLLIAFAGKEIGRPMSELAYAIRLVREYDDADTVKVDVKHTRRNK